MQQSINDRPFHPPMTAGGRKIRTTGCGRIFRGDPDERLIARIESYELAFRMQIAVPNVIDLNQEAQATHRMYGLDDADMRTFGRQCLMARRMVEKGIRFARIFSGGVKPGVVGATDDLGSSAVECVHLIRDLHVTLLHLLGLDDNRLTYFHAGRFKQLSQFGGQVISEIVA